MKREKLYEIFSAAAKLKVGVLGDYALDFYYKLNKESGEISLETSQSVYHASEPRPVPGGAGTLVKNLIALGVKDVRCFGLLGNDLFGRELSYLLEQIGANIHAMFEVRHGWETYVYSKPIIDGIEDNRIDFGTHNTVNPNDFEEICRRLEESLPDLDILIINQQFKTGITDPKRLPILKKLLQKFPDCFVISDLRESTGALTYGVIKGNLSEIRHFSGLGNPNSATDPEWIAQKAQIKAGLPILMTLGEKGMLYLDEKETHHIAGIPLEGPLDITGAGDACLAAFSSCMGIKLPIPEAIYIANLVAAISVQKLRETGSASPDEILALASFHPYS